ncbi:MAG: hypothetical protein V8R55_04640 [Dysosmobacter sp.]
MAIVLVLVILGAVGFMVLQEHIVYDGTEHRTCVCPSRRRRTPGLPRKRKNRWKS